MKNVDVKKLVFRILPFVLFFYFANKAGQAFRLAADGDISAKVLNIQGGFAATYANPLPSFYLQDILIGVIGAVIVGLALQLEYTMQVQQSKKDDSEAGIGYHTVFRELKRNICSNKMYSAITAHEKYEKRRKQCRRYKLLENTHLKGIAMISGAAVVAGASSQSACL